MSKTKILFVCLGNICRSPTAEGAFRHLVEEKGLEYLVEIDSAGTEAWHAGNPPDPRATSTALQRGIDLSSQRGRKVRAQDFDHYDHILAMDDENYDNLMRMSPSEHQYKIKLFLSFASNLHERQVPDPYYGGDQGFEHVLDLVQAASRGLLEEITGQGEK